MVFPLNLENAQTKSEKLPENALTLVTHPLSFEISKLKQDNATKILGLDQSPPRRIQGAKDSNSHTVKESKSERAKQ